MTIEARRDYKHFWATVQRVLRERYEAKHSCLLEELSFYIYRTDNNAILAKGIRGYDMAKAKADQIRKMHGLKWDQVKFRAERNNNPPSNSFGVSRDGQSFTNAYGQRGKVDYSPNYNPTKRRRFRTYTDKFGNEHDID